MILTAREWDRTFLWHFRAKWIENAYMDGDTFTVLTDQGYRGRYEPRIRIAGYSAPERHQPGGREATEWLRVALASGVGAWPLRIVSLQRETVITEVTSFERYVSEVYVELSDGTLRNVLEMLIR